MRPMKALIDAVLLAAHGLHGACLVKQRCGRAVRGLAATKVRGQGRRGRGVMICLAPPPHTAAQPTQADRGRPSQNLTFFIEQQRDGIKRVGHLHRHVHVVSPRRRPSYGVLEVPATPHLEGMSGCQQWSDACGRTQTRECTRGDSWSGGIEEGGRWRLLLGKAPQVPRPLASHTTSRQLTVRPLSRRKCPWHGRPLPVPSPHPCLGACQTSKRTSAPVHADGSRHSVKQARRTSDSRPTQSWPHRRWMAVSQDRWRTGQHVAEA